MRQLPRNPDVREVAGAIDPCKPDIFAATYEPLATPAPAAEATGEMSREDFAKHGSAMLLLVLQDARPRYDEFAVHFDAVAACDAALRTRAREAEEREAKWRSEMSAACELSERYRSIVTSALNQPPEYWYDKHDNGEWSASHAAHAIQALFEKRNEIAKRCGRASGECFIATTQRDQALRERDEAREQRDAATREARAAERKVAAAETIATSARARADKFEASFGAANAQRAAAVSDLTLTREQLATARLEALNEKARADTNDELVASYINRDRANQEALAAAEAERDRLRECHRTAAETAWAVSVARTKVEQALTAAEAEVKRLRLAYDDPSLDATDGAHPAWWRGNDAGVAGAVRIVNEALDGPLPLAGCVGGADLEAVRQRAAALRARAQRLEKAGDALVCRIDPDGYGRPALAAWAAAKEQK